MLSIKQDISEIHKIYLSIGFIDEKKIEEIKTQINKMIECFKPENGTLLKEDLEIPLYDNIPDGLFDGVLNRIPINKSAKINEWCVERDDGVHASRITFNGQTILHLYAGAETTEKNIDSIIKLLNSTLETLK